MPLSASTARAARPHLSEAQEPGRWVRAAGGCGAHVGGGAVQQRGPVCPRQDAGNTVFPPRLLRNKSHTRSHFSNEIYMKLMQLVLLNNLLRSLSSPPPLLLYCPFSDSEFALNSKPGNPFFPLTLFFSVYLFCSISCGLY